MSGTLARIHRRETSAQKRLHRAHPAALAKLKIISIKNNPIDSACLITQGTVVIAMTKSPFRKPSTPCQSRLRQSNLRQSIIGGLLLFTPLLLSPQAMTAEPRCPASALDRAVQHRVTANDTLSSIAQQYRLIPATIMGMNPSTRNGQVTPGSTLTIPPFNGIRIDVPAGTNVQTLATKYNVRADVLFEVNGCQANPRTAFIPGVNWSPNSGTSPDQAIIKPTIATQYPLPQRTENIMGYGWKLRTTDQNASAIGLHSGVDLAASPGTAVFATADGTIAFVGDKGSYGKLIVINHAQGYQTRYAQLGSTQVKLGQKVRRGQAIGTVGQSGQPSSTQAHLHFELRSNSKLGWVAEDPNPFLQ